MYKIMAWMEAYLKDEKGATAIEYGLIAGGISLAIVAAIFLVGEDLNTLWSTLAGKMESASTGTVSSS